MRKEELSIGNYVLWGNVVCCVTAIKYNEVYVTEIGDPSSNIAVDYKELRGLPISIDNVKEFLNIDMEEDITLFSMPDEHDYYDKSTHRLRLSNMQWKINLNPEDTVWYAHLDNQSYDSIGSADVCYIHQLQNFLSLFGIEVL